MFAGNIRGTMGLPMLCLCLALTSTVTARSAPPPKATTKYILSIIGDSLSDTGNTFRAASVPDANFYWRGRFTDGPNWVDYLQGAINKNHQLQIFNYAYGGAPACHDAGFEAAFPFVKNMTAQTLDFIADVASGKIPTGPNIKLVPVQWLGSNDLLFPLLRAKAANTLPSAADMAAVVQSLVTCRIAGARLLASVPGVKEVVLVPISPLHISPGVPAALKPQIKQLGDIISQQMVAAVEKLQAAFDAAKVDIRIHMLGDSTWIERGTQTTRPPFKAFDAPCFVNPSSLSPVPKNLNLTICDKPTEYLFYDEVHPETRFHNWFATKGFLPRMRNLRLLP